MAKKHWIYLKRGLSHDPKHRAQMGECIWLYMHIIDRADWETGIAYDWKDKEEAAEMGMPVDTLRRQRQKLEELDYIRAKQKQHSQDLYIMEWKNPRDYGSETKNPRTQGGHGSPPSTAQGLNQGSNQGLNQGGNQDQAQVKTPTSTSKSTSRVNDQTRPNFEDMSPAQARKLKPLQIWEKATGTFPGALLWETVYDTILNHNITVEKLRAVAIAWQGRGYKLSNVTGILEWAVHGIPAFVKPGAQAETPAGFHLLKPNVVCGQGGRLYDKCKETYGTDAYEATLNQFRIHVSGCRLCGDASNSHHVLGELNDLTKRMTTS